MKKKLTLTRAYTYVTISRLFSFILSKNSMHVNTITLITVFTYLHFGIFHISPKCAEIFKNTIKDN